MPSKWYLRDSNASNAPNSLASGVTPNNTATNNTVCKEMLGTAGSTQVEVACGTGSGSISHYRIWASPSLAGQTLVKGSTLKLAIAERENSISDNAYLWCYAYLYRPGVGKVCELWKMWQSNTEASSSQIGRAITSEGLPVDVAIKEGDKIVVEVYHNHDGDAGSNTYIYYDGTTEPTENSASSSAASYIECSTTLTEAGATLKNFVEEFSDIQHKDGANTTGIWQELAGDAQTTIGTEAADYNVTSASFTLTFDGANWKSQSFTPVSSGLLTKVDIYLSRDTGDARNYRHLIVGEIRTDDGTGKPSSTVLATAFVNAIDVVAAGGLVTFNFPQRPRLASGTKYHFVIHRRARVGAEDVYVSRNNGNPYANGELVESSDSGSTWSISSTNDLRMTVYIAPTTTGNKTVQSSGYDTGITDSNGVEYSSLAITKDEPTGTSVGTIEWSDSDDNSTWGSWTSDITTLSKRYIRWRTTTLNTTDTDETPRIQKISFSFQVRPASPKSVTDTGAGTDSVQINVLTTLTDTGNGTDAVTNITTQVPVSESGNGTDTPSYEQAVKVQEGPNDTCLHFGGTDAKVSFTPTTTPTTSDNHIISGWFKLDIDGWNAANSQPVMTYGYVYLYIRETTNSVRFRIDEASAREAPVFYLGNGDRSWHHFVGVYEYISGTSFRLSLYVDGRLIGTSSTFTTLPTSNKGYKIGEVSGGEFAGAVKKVRIWKGVTPPTAEQVRDLYLNDTEWTTPTHKFLLNEGTGTTVDDAGSMNNDGSITGSNYYWSTNEPGGVGAIATDTIPDFTRGINVVDGIGFGLYFTGSNYVRRTINSIYNTSVFTYMAWVKRLSTGAHHTIKGNTSSSGPQLRINSSNKLELLKENVISIGSSTGSITNDGLWHHVAVTYDASGNYVFYIDGVASGSGTNLQTFSFSDLLVGLKQITSEGMNGYIDDFRMYNRVLNATEIANSYIENYPTDAVLIYNFDEGSGTGALDSSGNNLDGTLTNSPTYIVGHDKHTGTGTDSVTDITTQVNVNEGHIGTSLYFGGSANASIPHNAAHDLPNAISVAFWCKTDKNTAPSAYFPLVNKGAYQTSGWQLFLLNYNSSFMRFRARINRNDTTSPFFSSIDAPDEFLVDASKWHLYVWTYDAGISKIYIDGVLANTKDHTTDHASYSSLITRVANTTLGDEGGRRLEGNMRDLYWWNRAITEAEVQSLYSSRQVPSSGLIGDWDLDEGTGTTINDDTGTQNGSTNGTVWTDAITGGVGGAGTEAVSLTNNISVQEGHIKEALFNAGGHYIHIPHATAINVGNNDSYSISGWFRANKVVDQSITEKWNSQAGAYPFAIRLKPTSGYIRFAIYDGSLNPAVENTTDLCDDRWHHFVAVRDKADGKIRLYVDGVFINSTTDNTVNVSNAQDMVIYARSTAASSYRFNGAIRDIRIHNRAFSLSEVQELFKGTASSSGLIGEWKINENTGTTANDTSGNANHGTISGGTWTTAYGGGLGGAGTDTASLLSSFLISDSGSGSDLVSILAQLSLSDSGVATDALSVLVSLAINDTATATDTLALIISFALSDSGTGNDTASVLASMTISDSGALSSELLSILASLSVSDSGSGTDTPSILNTFSLSDSGSGTDAASILAQLSIADSGVGSEVVSMLAQLAITDSGSASEALSLLVTLALTDSAVGTDAVSILVSLALTDSGVGSDAIQILVEILLSDTGTGTDTVAPSTLIDLRNVSDSGTGSDAISILAQLALADSGLASEILSVLNSFTVSDTSTGSDTVSIQNSLTISDSGTGSEDIAGNAIVSVTDSGTSIEALAILAQLAIADSGTGTDIPTLVNSLVIADSGVSSEVLQVLASISVSDSAVATEALSVLVSIAISDSGLAQEIIQVVEKLTNVKAPTVLGAIREAVNLGRIRNHVDTSKAKEATVLSGDGKETKLLSKLNGTILE